MTQIRIWYYGFCLGSSCVTFHFGIGMLLLTIHDPSTHWNWSLETNNNNNTHRNREPATEPRESWQSINIIQKLHTQKVDYSSWLEAGVEQKRVDKLHFIVENATYPPMTWVLELKWAWLHVAKFKTSFVEKCMDDKNLILYRNII